MIENELSRRQLLVRSAAAAAGLSLSMSLLAAQRAKAEIDPTPDPVSDRSTLLALLAAEYGAIQVYTAGAAVIAADSSADDPTKSTVTKVALHFQSQHQDHANAIAQLITATGGTPPTQDTTAAPSLPDSFKNKATKTVLDVIKLACDKEKGAAVAYAGAMQKLSTKAASQLVAAIGGVETQHFVVLYLLAEGMVSGNVNTNTMAQLIVPASFILDLGLSNTTSLDKFPALDALLALDPKPMP